MSQGKQLYEGKAKVIFEGPEPGTVIQYFKDDATAFNAQKKGTIIGKGVLNCAISSHIFEQLGELGIPTHFIKTLSPREQLVHHVDIVPVEVIVRNVLAGSICKRLGLTEGDPLDESLIEFCYKSDEHGDPVISADHAVVLGWATEDEMEVMRYYTMRINDFLRGMCVGVGIRLVDFKLEFGRIVDDDGETHIILADEISPDTCRFWDMETGKKLDKDRFRRDLGDVEGAYIEIAGRFGVLPKEIDGEVKGEQKA
jgi:phosphoribosylaminoimidazole-succinocarboxamide synthase